MGSSFVLFSCSLNLREEAEDLVDIFIGNSSVPFPYYFKVFPIGRRSSLILLLEVCLFFHRFVKENFHIRRTTSLIFKAFYSFIF